MSDFDLFVIGAGSGGVRAARVAAQLGARVGIAESGALGGTCVNVGCVPKKLLVYGSQFAHAFADARGFGWRLSGSSFDWPTLIANKDAEIRRLNDVYRSLLEDAGVQLVHGRARLTDHTHVEVAGSTHRARHVLIATGGRPFLPSIPGIEHAITSDDAFYLGKLPRRALVIGGGYIAVEFASIFRGLGCDVVIVHRGDYILRGFDEDIRSRLALELAQTGIELRRGLQVESIERSDGSLRITLGDGEVLETDLVLAATGREPNTSGLGLEETGVALGPRDAVQVDDYGRTSVDNIFAVGDCTDRINLTPVALAEGQAVAHTLFGPTAMRADRRDVPSAVFSQPPVATVGLTEEEARELHHDVDIYRSTFTPMRNTLSGRPGKTMMKLVVDRKSDRVLGVHMVGDDAGEIIQGFAVALKGGATKAQFDATIGIHPTAAEELVTMRAPVRSRPAF